jgi:hypothetical protein
VGVGGKAAIFIKVKLQRLPSNLSGREMVLRFATFFSWQFE